MQYQFLDPWHRYLPREGGHLIALFGGGGKTRLSRLFAAIYRAEQVPVLLTTTTRSEPLAWPELRARDVRDGLPPAADLLFLHRGVGPDGKWRGLSPAEVDALGTSHPEHVVIVEADGSAGHPVKLHREDEPVWPRRTSLAVAVVGLSAVGRPVAEVLHRHGRLTATWLEGSGLDAPWTWELTARLVARYLDRVPPGVPALVVLTQMDVNGDTAGLLGLVGRLLQEHRVPLVTLAALQEDLHVQTVYLGERPAPAAPDRSDGDDGT